MVVKISIKTFEWEKEEIDLRNIPDFFIFQTEYRPRLMIITNKQVDSLHCLLLSSRIDGGRYITYTPFTFMLKTVYVQLLFCNGVWNGSSLTLTVIYCHGSNGNRNH